MTSWLCPVGLASRASCALRASPPENRRGLRPASVADRQAASPNTQRRMGETNPAAIRRIAVADAAVLREVERMLRSAMLVQVGWRADQVARHLTEPPHNKRGVGQDGDTDCRVEALADDIDHRVTQVEID